MVLPGKLSSNILVQILPKNYKLSGITWKFD